MPPTRAVGIDLGTTYSAAATVTDTGRTAMIPNARGEALTPSVVLFEEYGVIVGHDARQARATACGSVAELVKRDMGSPVYSRPIRGAYMPPEAIQACILRQLQADAVRAIGPEFEVVITVPAFFDEVRRRATAEAGEMAGLRVLDMVNEPTAAALAFGEEFGYLTGSGSVDKRLTVLVYDLGGGTFDATFVMLEPGQFKTIATDGDVRLGGHDWDMRLVDHAAEAFMSQYREDPRSNPVSLQHLLAEAEEAKRTLSMRRHAKLRVDHAGSVCEVAVTREMFEQRTADLLHRTGHTTRQVLAAAHLTWENVDRILMVGGSTRMPMVSRMLESLSGITPDHAVHPDEAVPRGAALYAAYLLRTRSTSASSPTQTPGFTVTNVNSHSLGVEGLDIRTGRKRNVILIPRNTPLPASATKRFATKQAGQPSIVVQVLEGESSLPSGCAPVGRTVIRDLPSDLPKGTRVRVTFEYGTNGRLSVSADVPEAQRQVHFELERQGRRASQTTARWRQVLAQGAGFEAMRSLAAGDEDQSALAEPTDHSPASADPAVDPCDRAVRGRSSTSADLADDEIPVDWE